MGNAQKIASQKENNWDLEQAVRETGRNFSTDLQLQMTETTNAPILLKTLVCLERQQHELIPEEYQPHTVNPVRCGFHRTQNYCPKEPPNNNNQLTTQGSSRHQ